MDLASVRVRGIEAVCAEQGVGDPALFVHGWGGAASHWRKMWGQLVPRYRCLAPDLPGWGLSEKPDVPYTIEWYADWLADLLEARGASPAMVAGHSMGATIALALAQRHPGRVARLALLNSIVRGADGLRAEARFLSMPVIRTLAFPFTRTRRFLRFIARNFTQGPELEEIDLLLIARGTYASMTRSLDSLKRIDLTPGLESVRCPTLVVGTDADREIPPLQTDLAAQIPGAQRVTIEGAGHVPILEQPDRTASALIDFFGPGARRARPPQW
jgi:pimeloyl-ACP methyl ester carboxylesterase